MGKKYPQTTHKRLVWSSGGFSIQYSMLLNIKMLLNMKYVFFTQQNAQWNVTKSH